MLNDMVAFIRTKFRQTVAHMCLDFSYKVESDEGEIYLFNPDNWDKKKAPLRVNSECPLRRYIASVCMKEPEPIKKFLASGAEVLKIFEDYADTQIAHNEPSCLNDMAVDFRVYDAQLNLLREMLNHMEETEETLTLAKYIEGWTSRQPFEAWRETWS